MPRFRNLDDAPHFRTPANLLRWKLGMHPAAATKPARRLHSKPTRDPASVTAAPFVHNDGALVRSAARPALTWVGHATYLVQLGGLSLLTDPVLGERISGVLPRAVAPGLAWSALPRIDAVLLTHNHRDHMDEPSLVRLGPSVRYVVPRGMGAWFRKKGLARVDELDWWQRLDIGGAQVTFVPSQHWSRRGLFDEDQSLWGGYVVEGSGRRVYHSGDTAYFSGFGDIARRVGPLDAAMLPIGAYEPRWFMRAQHMNPEDAVQAFVDLGARTFVAMHWGTFALTDEPLDEPPAFLQRVWRDRGLDEARLRVPAVGETVWLDEGP